jgi:hypothetical protein
MLKYT